MLYRNSKIAALVIIAGLVSNCADTLLTAEGFAGKKSTACTSPGATTTSISGGAFETSIDATCETAWSYFDLDTKTVMAVTSPTTDTTWELGFQRFKVKINGGVSGAGAVTLLPIDGDVFGSLNAVPGTFVPALNDLDDPAGDPNSACRPAGVHYAFLNTTATPQGASSANACWFAYNLYGTHSLDARAITYVLKTNVPKYYKIKVDNYYSSTGTSGVIKFRWKEL